MQGSIREISDHYFKKGYTFSVNNLKTLLEVMSAEDREVFNCDLARVDWPQHFDDCYMRFRRHVLKEPDSNIKDAIKRINQ